MNGLMGVIKMENNDQTAVAIGNDLNSLGLDVDNLNGYELPFVAFELKFTNYWIGNGSQSHLRLHGLKLQDTYSSPLSKFLHASTSRLPWPSNKRSKAFQKKRCFIFFTACLTMPCKRHLLLSL